MLVSNLTSYDIYFGPLRLAAGASNVTIDDTSATSLYLTDDTVADALNNAYLATKISVSGQALPFPRPTGDPQILHGSGSPEGSVYAPQGSTFMRRDNNGAGNALYAKTSGRTFSTGWQSFAIPVASVWSGGPPSMPLDGDIWIATGVDGNGTVWQFRYNAGSASSYKWEFIGGSAAQAQVLTYESIGTTGSWQNLATDGPKFNVVRAGDYACAAGAVANSAGSVQNTMDLGVAAGNIGPTNPIAELIINQSGYAPESTLVVRSRLLAVSAATDLKLRYQVAGSTGSQYGHRWLEVLPIRIS